jgi:spermidine/putrescine transport system substrate-binding protein
MTSFDSGSALSRRRLLTATAGAGAALTLGAPFVARRGLASSGEVNFMGWAGYDFKPTFDAFAKKTGIKVNFIEQPDQDAMAAQAKAGGVGAYDLSEPAADRVVNWVEQGFIQPLDPAKLDVAGVEPAFLKGDAGEMVVVDGKRYGTPSVWGTEALLFNSDEVKLEYGTASLGDLFDPAYAGKVTMRPHSGLAAIGRWLDAQGKLPKPYRSSFKDEATMTANYEVIVKKAIEIKPQIGQFWKDENSAQGAFRTNGCVIGQCWDTTAAALQKEGFPAAYLSPKEGAMAWLQNFVMFKGAKNEAQAYEFLKFVNSAEGSALWATAFGANPVAKGAVDKMPDTTKTFLKTSFPGDALEKLWWWPAQTSWFVAKRNEYADQFQAG